MAGGRAGGPKPKLKAGKGGNAGGKGEKEEEGGDGGATGGGKSGGGAGGGGKGGGGGGKGGGKAGGKGGGKGGGGAGEAPILTKAEKKAAKAAQEAARKKQQDSMMALYNAGDSEGDDEPMRSDDEVEREIHYDRFGNIISKEVKEREARQEARKRALLAKAQAAEGQQQRQLAAIEQQEQQEKEREEGGSGRKKKGRSLGEGLEERSPPVLVPPAPPEKQATDFAAAADREMMAASEKAAAGGKLSNKEKKLVARWSSRKEEYEREAALQHSGLSAFALTLAGDGSASTADNDGVRDVVIRNFSIAAPKRELFRDATLKIAHGRRYGLLGPNGRGKSTLLRYLQQRMMPVPPGVDVLLVEQEIQASDLSVVELVLAADTKRNALLAEEEQLLAQMEEQKEVAEDDDDDEEEEEGDDDDDDEEEEEEENEKEEGKGGQQQKEKGGRDRVEGDGEEQVWSRKTWRAKAQRLGEIGSELDAIGADKAEAKVRRILTGLQFTEEMQDGPTTILSGGWRMRVSLATALFVEPALLLLDEPTNHLDLYAVLWLDDYLSNHWTHSLLVVSHDQDFLDSVCTDIIHLDALQLRYYGHGVDKFRKMALQVQDKTEKDYKLQEKEILLHKRKGEKSSKAEEAAMKKLGIETLIERPKEYRVKFSFASPDDTVPSISVLGVSFGYRKDKPPIFSNLYFKVDTDTRVAIVGPNGAGKSTLLKIISKQIDDLELTSGEVTHHRHLRIGRYDQHFEELLPLRESPMAFLSSTYNVPEQQSRKVLGQFGLDGARHLIPIRELSGGQKARVVFASLSLQRPSVLLLDEPTNHLDMESVEALIAGVKAFKGGVVLVSHDANLIAATECELWVVPGDGSLQVHTAGFDNYRTKLLRELAIQEQKAMNKAMEKAEMLRRRRVERSSKQVGKGGKHMSKHMGKLSLGSNASRRKAAQEKANPTPPGPSPAEMAELEERKASVNTLFNKKAVGKS